MRSFLLLVFVSMSMVHSMEYTSVTLLPEVAALTTNPTHYGDPTGGCMTDELPA